MSIKLPRKLAPWEPQLRIFPEEIALALGPLIQKLAALLGPFPHHHTEGHVVPDGFAGLDKRGSYERLVASDWLLADELPDEFMRRSVMGEHLFWKIAYHEPFQARSSLVLFDAGPEQLGSPRLLHLAALAVFDARARMAKANFRWGILQSSDCDLLPGINYAEVEILLGARGSVSTQEQHFAAWMQRASEAGFDGEIWVVGSERLRRFLPKTFSTLLITDLLSPGERKLRAECRPAGKHSRHIELELPDSSSCAQLLRDPFAAATARQQKLEKAAITSMVFNQSGNKLLARTQDGKLAMFAVPNSPRHRVGPPKYYQTVYNFPPIAAGRVPKRTVIISMNPVSLVFTLSSFGKLLPRGLQQGEHSFHTPQIKPLFSERALSFCVWHRLANEKPGLYFLDEAGSLLRLFSDQHSVRWCEVVHHHVLALTQTALAMCYAIYEKTDDGGQVSVYLGNSTVRATSWSASWVSPQAPIQAFFGYGSRPENLSFGYLAVRYSENHWEILSRGARSDVLVPRDFSVHGVLQHGNYEEALVVVESDRQTLSLLGARETRPLIKAESPIQLVCTCPQQPLIAYTTAAGKLAIYSLRHGKLLLDIAGSTP
jgi:hypothetical protein